MSRTKFTADPEAAKAKRDAAMQRLADGVAAIQTSEGFRDYLKVASRFHRYSFRNQILIWSQMPEATRVAGFHAWKDLGRSVKKGESGIAIFAPMTFKVKDDQRTLDGDDEPETRTGFRLVYVFDYSQTEGEPLPSLDYQHTQGESAHALWAGVEAVAADKAITLSIDEADRKGGANGYYLPPARKIWIDPALSLDGRTSTALHELAHAIDYEAHEAAREAFDYAGHRGERETVAEAVSYIVADHFGLDTGTESFTYIAVWAKDDKTFKARMSEVQVIADRLITALEGAGQ